MPFTLRKILLGLHGKAENQPTLRFAEQLAGLYGADLSTVPDVQVESLLAEAGRGTYDLVVVPWIGEPRQDRIALRIANEAEVSVLVVKGQPDLPTHLLVCSGGRPIAEPVIRTGAALARAVGGKATLLHVTSAVPAMYSGLDAMDESIEDLMSGDTPEAEHLRAGAQIFKEDGVEATFELRHGVPVEEILRSVQVGHQDLVVIGASSSASRLSRLFFDQVAEKILEVLPCSVLVVRPPEKPEDA